VVALQHWRVAVFGVAAVSVAAEVVAITAAVVMTAAGVMTAGAADGALKTFTTATGAWICHRIASVGGRRWAPHIAGGRRWALVGAAYRRWAPVGAAYRRWAPHIAAYQNNVFASYALGTVQATHSDAPGTLAPVHTGQIQPPAARNSVSKSVTRDVAAASATRAKWMASTTYVN
jgi:hypothetical protein